MRLKAIMRIGGHTDLRSVSLFTLTGLSACTHGVLDPARPAGLKPRRARASGLRPTTLLHHQITLVALAVITLTTSNPCRAIDPQPGDWETYPAKNVVMGFADFTTSSQLDNTTIGTVPNSHLDTAI